MTKKYAERWDAGCDSRPLLEEADREIEQLRADISEAYYLRDKAEGRFCTALGTIEQLHAAVKTAQELAARRLMEIERLQSNQREHIQEITELTQNRDDYKADYLRMHKMFMDLKYPDTVPAHEPCEQRCDCLERISALIVKGPLEGDGWDPTAQRNGIILAANHIASFNRPAPQGASRDLSASESASFHKTLARSPRRIGAGIPPDGAPSMPEGASRDASSEPAKCSFCGETKIHGQNCGYFGQPVRT